MINGIGIVGFRDPNGIRPLVFGSRQKRGVSPAAVEGGAKDFLLSSESVVMDTLGFELTREFVPSVSLVRRPLQLVLDRKSEKAAMMGTKNE